MKSITASNYLARAPIEQALRKFATSLPVDARVLDIGCGHKPYAHFFPGAYRGVDIDPDSAADIIADSAAIPLPSASYDAVILTQSLQNIRDVPATVREVYRLLKPGGRCFISAPLVAKLHATPFPSTTLPVVNFSTQQVPTWQHDYWRFTKFGLIVLLRQFSITDVTATTGYVATLCQLGNYFFASFPYPRVFLPIYLLSNLLGVTADRIAAGLAASNIPFFRRLYYSGYMALPLNYIVVARKEHATSPA